MDGKATATCGHQIEIAWSQHGAVYVKAYNRMGERCLSYRVLCPACLKYHQKQGLIANTSRSQKLWLSGKK